MVDKFEECLKKEKDYYNTLKDNHAKGIAGDSISKESLER